MLDSLINFITVLLALSIASERLVELVKGIFSSLNGAKQNSDDERVRQLQVHWMSLLAAFLVVFLTQDYIISSLKLTVTTDIEQLPLGPGLLVAFSILASGGSSMWNSLLTYMLSLKDLKQQQVVENKDQRQQKAVDIAKASNPDLTVALPLSMPKV